MHAVLSLVFALQLAAPTTRPATQPADDAAVKERNVSQYNLKRGLALGGYDPVAYFPEGGSKPVKGKSSITATHDNVTYRFANKDNRDKFLKRPQRYEPAYGGWCAYAVGAKGQKVTVDPKAFTIEDGRLFVFYRTFVTDTRKPWKKDHETLQPAAEANWQKITGEKPVINEFALTSVGDAEPMTFRLSEHRGQYVALHFLLETRCPICQAYTLNYHRKADEFKNVKHVFIKPDSEAAIEGWVKDIRKRPAIYRDPDAALAKQLNIKHGYKFHGKVMHYPAFVLIDPNGREAFRFTGRNNRERFKVDDFTAKFPHLLVEADAK